MVNFITVGKGSSRRKIPLGKGTRIQAFRFKEGNRFKSKKDVDTWLKKNQVRTSTIKLTKEDSEYSARQIPPNKIDVVGSKPISDDVRIIIGFPKK
jgi:hypothetical protein